MSLLLSLMVSYVDPFYARMAEEACLEDMYKQEFMGTNDLVVSVRARYKTFVDAMSLLPGERIIVVDVEVAPSADGLCRLYCLSWNCIYPAKVLCWSSRVTQLPGCSYLRFLHEGEDQIRCVGEGGY